MSEVRDLAIQARAAGRRLSALERAPKDAALHAIAERLRARSAEIGEINARDVEAARAAGVSAPMIQRLQMGADVVEATAQGVEFVASLVDPVGSRAGMQRLPNGLLIGKQRIPLGVIAMIYESRPNVTVDAAVLCLKAGNACLLRGGKEAQHTNRYLGELIQEALAETGLPEAAVQIVPATDRAGIAELVSLAGLIDLAIPRGGEGLIRFVHENARVPTVEHYKGVCHLFVDRGADLAVAQALVLNSKLQKPGVCNALECVLVDRAEAAAFLPALAEQLAAAGAAARACPSALSLMPGATAATDADWGAEFLDKILAVRVVDDLEQALDHIARFGSNHTEAICTRDYGHAQRWLREVDASCVLVNASTRFNDGGQLGLGAEIGISTTKLHAYGPMGLESLTAEKWVVLGDGQVRS